MYDDSIQGGPVPAEMAHVADGALRAASSLPPIAAGARIGAGELKLRRRKPKAPFIITLNGAYLRSTRTKDAAKAQAALEVCAKQMEAERQGIWDVRGARVEDVIGHFLDLPGRSPATQASICQALRRLEKYVAGKYVRELDGKWRAATMKALAEDGYRDATIELSLNWLLVAIRRWCRDHSAPLMTPFAPPPRAPGRERILSADEQARALRWAFGEEDYDAENGSWLPPRRPLNPVERHRRNMFQRLIVLGLATGSRAGAFSGLGRRPSRRYGWIDEREATLFRNPVGAPAKANKRRPPVRLSPAAMAHVRRWREEDGPSENWILRTLDGRPMRTHRAAALFRGVMHLLGIHGVTRHTCRHTVVSGLVQKGVPGIVIGSLAGMGLKTLRDRYNHADDRTIQWQAHEALDALFAEGIDIVD